MSKRRYINDITTKCQCDMCQLNLRQVKKFASACACMFICVHLYEPVNGFSVNLYFRLKIELCNFDHFMYK